VPVEIHHLRVPHSVAKAEVVDALVRPVNDYLEQRSHLLLFVKKRLETMLMRSEISADYFPDEFKKNTRESSRWDVTTGMLDQPSRLIGDRLRARHLDVVDVLGSFRAMNAKGPKLYGDVDRHLSPRGHEVLALLVEPRVRELLR
jgi:hypothetical protein